MNGRSGYGSDRGWVWSVFLGVGVLLAGACGGGGPASSEASSEPLDPYSEAAQYTVPPEWTFAAQLGSPVVESSGGMVATDARLATDVGVQVLDEGGNAIDAAVATAFALAVVYPAAGNIGGGGFVVLRLASGEVAALDFREKAPMAASRNMYLDEEGELTRDSIIGHRAVGVPGSVAGLWEAHRRYGSMSWQQVMEPAIRLAEEGFIADASFARSAGSRKFERFDASRRLFWPDGEPLEEGDTWSNPELAAVLRRISERGPEGFYEGETAELIIAEMGRGGGLITHEDLRAYEAKWRDPVVFDYRGYEVVSMPPPSSGGLTLALIANIIEGYDLRQLGWHSPVAIHTVTEAMRRAFADRNHWLGDPDFVDNPGDMFLSEEYAGQLRASIRPDSVTPSDKIQPDSGSDGSESMHTTHFSIVDAAGNAVALTTTLNHGNGSGVTVTGAGFLLNNEMDDFASKPGSPNAFGLVQGEANAIEPGKRMLSAMTPTIVVYENEAILVTGASGGPTIITGVFQIMTNVLDYGFDIGTAVRLPRFHQQHLPDVLRYEADGLSAQLIAELKGIGHEMMAARFRIATGASLLRVGGGWTGTHDPRALGKAQGQE